MEQDDIAVDTVSAISVNRIGADGAVDSVVTDAALSDLISDGAVVLRTVNGSITVNEGIAPAGGVITLSGNILLEAGTTGANDKQIRVNARITSSSGSISLVANADILQGPNGDLSVFNGRDARCRIPNRQDRDV